MGKYDRPTPEQREIEQLQAQGVNGTVARMLIKMQKQIDEQNTRIRKLEIDMQVYAGMAAYGRIEVSELIDRLTNALSHPFQE